MTHLELTDEQTEALIPGADPDRAERSLPPQSRIVALKHPWDDAAGARSPRPAAPAKALRAAEPRAVCAAPLEADDAEY
jgi:hypothetical protein